MEIYAIQKSSRGPIIKNPLFIYETVARIISGVIKKEGTLRSLVYAHTQRLIKTHLRLAIEVTRHRNLLERLIAKTDLIEQEDISLELAQVLVYELLLSPQKELPHGIDIFDRVSSYSTELKAELEKIQKTKEIHKLVVERPEATLPRYVRVNTLLTTLEIVLQKLKRLGYQLLDTEGKSYDEFLDCVRELGDKQFAIDFHFPEDLLVFNPREFISKLSLHHAGHLAIHDKTSYFPVACLGAPVGSQVLDACAAPGMKTAHIAARLQNNGTIYAFDPHELRYNLLLDNLTHSGVTCCQSKCKDFISVNPHDAPISNVEYLLLDPPCTGSGIVNRLDYLTDDLDSKSSKRIWTLSALQFKFLCHALKFPNVQRIVYSTCSVEVQENEKVIQDVLSKNPGIFKVVEAFPEWCTRGDPEFEFGNLCVRAEPLKDMTNGFFVAVLERINEQSEAIDANMYPQKMTEVVENIFSEKKKEVVGFKAGKEIDVRRREKHLKDQARRRKKRNKRGKREREMLRTGADEYREAKHSGKAENKFKGTKTDFLKPQKRKYQNYEAESLIEASAIRQSGVGSNPNLRINVAQGESFINNEAYDSAEVSNIRYTKHKTPDSTLKQKSESPKRKSSKASKTETDENIKYNDKISLEVSDKSNNMELVGKLSKRSKKHKEKTNYVTTEMLGFDEEVSTSMEKKKLKIPRGETERQEDSQVDDDGEKNKKKYFEEPVFQKQDEKLSKNKSKIENEENLNKTVFSLELIKHKKNKKKSSKKSKMYHTSNGNTRDAEDQLVETISKDPKQKKL